MTNPACWMAARVSQAGRQPPRPATRAGSPSSPPASPPGCRSAGARRSAARHLARAPAVPPVASPAGARAAQHQRAHDGVTGGVPDRQAPQVPVEDLDRGREARGDAPRRRPGERVRPRRARRRLEDTYARPSEHPVNSSAEIAIFHQQIARLPRRPDTGRMTLVRAVCHGDRNAARVEKHRIDVEKVARQDAGGGVTRNWRQVGEARRRAGPSPSAAKIRRTIPSLTRYPRPTSSPLMRRCQRGFSRASRTIRSRCLRILGAGPAWRGRSTSS
jgi:hypothetical protein